MVIELLEVRLGALEGLDYALANGHARHDDDELREPVLLVELENGPNIDIRLARSGLHLHREISESSVCDDLCARKAILLLHKVQILRELPVGYTQAISVADGKGLLLAAAPDVAGELAGKELLALEQVDHGIYRLCLVLLIG